MRGYNLPANLDTEISQLEELVQKYKRGEVSATELKAHRVPFGVYEQRQAGTYMVRIRCTGGFVTPLQLRGISDIALQHGISDLHITSRQELQIHYAKLDDIIPIIRQLKEAGLATRGGGGNTVRNIAVQEDAGCDPQEEFDVSPYAWALTTKLIAESDSWNLPRKFKIAFSGSKEDKGYATLSDVGFIAKNNAGKYGFRVYAAGGLGAKPQAAKLLLDFIDAEEVYPVAKALKNLFYKYGNRKNKHASRLRFLWQSLGSEEFKQKFQEEYAKIKAQGLATLAISDVPVGVSVPGLKPEEPSNTKDFVLWKKRFVKSQKQDGLFSVLIAVELGFISCECASKLAQFLVAFGEDTLRLTRDQNFLLRNIPEKYLANLYNFLKNTLPDFNQPLIYSRMLSCAGASTCQLGICLSRQAVLAIMAVLEKSGIDLEKIGDVKLNISGCPNSCGQHQAADLGFFGKAKRAGDRLYPAYNVVCAAVIGDGTTTLAQLVGEISARDLPFLIKELFELYLSKQTGFKNFQEYIRSQGKKDLAKLCGNYAQVPDFEENKNYYFDWGADKVFSLADRKAGECSAGVFDLIEMDLGNIKKTKTKLLTPGLDQNIKKQLILELIFYSSRSLLVTQGIEPKNEAESYAGFLEHFIETGLVKAHFKELINFAQKKDTQVLLTKEKDAVSLAEAVERLYENMDNSFNFKKAAAAEPSKENIALVKAKIVKDFRGVPCPLNFVKTKVELSKLKTEEFLEIWLDDGEPIENVPGSVKAEGHTIISQTKINNYWVVIIQKK